MILGSTNVYFQPPAEIHMRYPAIVYHRDNSKPFFADNSPYFNRKRWSVTVIFEDGESDLPDRIEALPLCRFERAFRTEGLYHNIFNLYF